MGDPVSEEPGHERVIAGRYRLLSPLGQGGMGTVWRARDEVLHREVAVKEVRAPAGLPTPEVERMYTRLEREAWAAARVANRNVVTVYDVAHEDGRPWIVMELIRGIALSDLLDAEGPISPQRAAHIGAEVLAALRAAHAAGVLHRDVKPGNVLLANDGRAVLTDFGIAMVEGSSALTMTGEVIGSPEFLAPERALGRTPGPESDLWSLGVLLYAAVEGNSPFRQNTPLSTLRAVVDEELPPPRRAGPLAAVIEGLLRKDPAERIPAERAERDLRIIGAGGTPRTGTSAYTPNTPYTPTVAAFSSGPPTPPHPTPTPTPAPTPAAGAATRPVHQAPPEPPDRNRRAAVVLIAGVAALALAVAGLTYALVNRDNGSGGRTGTNSESTHSDSGGGKTSSSTGDNTKGGGAPTGERSAPRTSGAPSTTPPAQSVRVTVTGSHTEYSGVCPPPEAEAPRFTATFTVGSVPVDLSYRWVARTGQLSDPDWKTLSFPAGEGRTKQQQIVITSYDTDGPVHNEISVEVRSPVRATSNSVPFSVTCETETPTGGASPSSS
ncbi:serine/threonine-protein kinase [Streptomyces yaanensis]|uniref:non-specific serine/threonine protein kinase n=1 Tax=Streptomyces yaanensis TaxID=1142239 RepID=A0ABV7SMZ4_9ACTN|nr:serine/threonine-protein kinase [Streptomyces sp. CGMCC 4.7035]WNC00917.1 serine/threonine-protein kinase [Streptomyces sp. CGMCC 4.7035]